MPRTPFGYLAQAAAVAALLFTVTGCGSSEVEDPAKTVQRGLAAVKGIPQRGSTIGRFDAPATLTIVDWVTDLRLADALQNDLGDVIDGGVRAGNLKIQLRTIRFGPDPDSGPAAQIVQSAGLQGAFWQALVAFVPNYTGVLDEDAAQQAFTAAGVPSVSAALGARNVPQVIAAIDRADQLAREKGVRNAPKYLLSRRDGSTVDLSGAAADAKLSGAITKALKR